MPAIPVKMPVVNRAAAPTLIAPNHRSAIPETSEVPPARNPVAVRIVAGDPYIPRSRAGRNVSRRSARIDPKFSCLGCRCSQSQSASHHGCAQHPIPHAVHKPSILAALNAGRSGFCSLEACLLPHRRAPVMSYANTCGSKGCGHRAEINFRNFPTMTVSGSSASGRQILAGGSHESRIQYKMRPEGALQWLIPAPHRHNLKQPK
jgi:hypothetical protein